MSFLYFGQILMDNHKLVMISILHFKNMRKMQFLFFFNENMLGKLLGFGCMHKYYIFCVSGKRKFIYLFLNSF